MEDGRSPPTRSGLRGYVSYSHADRKDVARLRTHLRTILRDRERIDFWADGEINAGDRWSVAISDAIAAADVFVTCMSADYLASEFRYHMEWPSIVQRVRGGRALLVPVILRPCMWFGFVEDFQAVPLDRGRVRPISDWRPRDAGFHRATEQIADAVRRQFAPSEIPRALPPVHVELPATGMVPFAPAENEKLSSDDIDEAVKTILGRRAAKSGA